jgi:hypothetical protein
MNLENGPSVMTRTIYGQARERQPTNVMKKDERSLFGKTQALWIFVYVDRKAQSCEARAVDCWYEGIGRSLAI